MTTISLYTGDVPNLTQPQPDFDVNTQAILDYIGTLAVELNAYAAALNSLDTTSTSTTSLLIGTGTKNLTVQTGKSYFEGQSVTIARTSAPTNRMIGVVVSYNSGTGALVVSSQLAEGSGTYTDWTITLSAAANSTVNDDSVSTVKVQDKAITYAKIQDISATKRLLGRNSALAGVTEEVTLTQLLDWIGSAAQGDILYRGASAWERLAAGASGQFLKTLGAGANPLWAAILQGFTLGTPVATTSGSAIDFGSIPAGTKVIILSLAAVSCTLAVNIGFRIGTGGSPQTTGYNTGSGSIGLAANTTLGANSTTGFVAAAQTSGNSDISGSIMFTLLDASTNTWAAFGVFTSSTPTLMYAGVVSLSGALDIVRIYGGTFDAGKANIAYI